MLSACKTVLAYKPVRALQGEIQSDGVSPVLHHSVIPAKAGIQSDSLSPVLQRLQFSEETSRDWPRRATHLSCLA